MKAVFVPVALFASAVAAQSSSGSSCAADYIVDACLGTQNGILGACHTNDYECSCAAYQGIVTCFNNCPGDTRRSNFEGQVSIFCGYAKQFPSKTTAPSASATGSPGTVVMTAAATAVMTATATPTGPPIYPSLAPGNSGATGLVMNAGGMLAAIAGVAAALL